MKPAPRVLRLLAGRFAVCRLDPASEPPAWAFRPGAALASATRTRDELSVVCDEASLPDADAPGVRPAHVERGWRALALEGPIPFEETGVLAALAEPLARAGVPLFALSTHDTDLILVKERDLERALAALGERHVLAKEG
ncbi:MAG TPA: ACT domain-containing protein [Candidatus Eisenbacteria bacterium]